VDAMKPEIGGAEPTCRFYTSFACSLTRKRLRGTFLLVVEDCEVFYNSNLPEVDGGEAACRFSDIYFRFLFLSHFCSQK